MDQLRREAERSELASAVASIKILRNRMLVSRSSVSDQVVAGLTAVLRLLECEIPVAVLNPVR
jgi:hypothetical protein